MSGKSLLHRVAVQTQTVSSDNIEVKDLAVNPLSAVLVAIRPLNNTGTITNYARYLAAVGSLNRLAVLFQGQSIVSASGRDLAAFNYFRHGILPMEANADDVDDDRRCVVLPVLLGRFAYDPVSCFPASRRGELTLELDIDVADTGYDGFTYTVETIELLGVSPKEYERRTTVSQTMVVGDNDINLPIGHDVRGLLAFGTTGFAGAAPAPTLGRMALFVDNTEHSISSSDFEVAMALGQLMGRQPPALDAHTHRVDATAASTTEETGGPIEQASGGWNNYCFFDLDPTRDDMFSVNVRQASSFFLRVNAETADAARVIACERVRV